jgi:DNA polymerase III subunit delta'
MAFTDFPEQAQGVELLQRSLKRGRLGHAYLFSGVHLEELEGLARTLAKTLNCQNPVKSGGVAVDCCDACVNCRKIEHQNHADVFWVRPESKTRIIKIGQITRRPDSPARVLMEVVNLKPTESEFKVCVVVAADRLKDEAANAFLKTLEEPPAKSILVLLTIEPQRILETILSRCLRLNFGGEGRARFDAEQMDWLRQFSAMAAGEQKSLLGRYRLMDVLLQKLAGLKERVEEGLSGRSPLEQYPDAEKELRDKWEDELKAAIEAEYRRQRGDLLLMVQWWLRDVWLQTLAMDRALLNFPEVAETEQLARRLAPARARQNLQVIEQTQRLLYTNVQEALALEVGMLKLQL